MSSDANDARLAHAKKLVSQSILRIFDSELAKIIYGNSVWIGF
jgi:hypothetical protein